MFLLFVVLHLGFLSKQVDFFRKFNKLIEHN
jgi:hypothetical protein